MNISASYAASITSAPPGYVGAIQSAISDLDRVITNPISVNITFGWGEVNGSIIPAGAAGENVSNGYSFSYAQVKAGLAAAATSADDFAAVSTLPSTDPTGGGRFFVTLPEAQALHLAGPSSAVSGWVGLNSSLTYAFDPAHRAVPGAYDAIGVLEHEITEVLGRIGAMGTYDGAGVYTPLDLFRYSAPGVRQLSPGAGSLSIDGHTLLQAYNNPATGGDVSDWINSLRGDAFGAAYQGATGVVTATDVREMDVLGYSVASPASPPPISPPAVSPPPVSPPPVSPPPVSPPPVSPPPVSPPPVSPPPVSPPPVSPPPVSPPPVSPPPVSPPPVSPPPVSPPPVSPPPAPAAGLLLTADDSTATLQGGAGADTLVAGHGAGTLIGGPGADVFLFGVTPWNAGKIADFALGTDRLDFGRLFAASHYAGADPVADGFVAFHADGSGGTIVTYDTDGPANGNPWPFTMTDLVGVSPVGLTWSALSGGAAASPPAPASPPPVSPPPASPPPVSPPPASPPPPSNGAGVTLTSTTDFPGSTMTGGAGSDTLTAGRGSDTMTGGPGADHFVFPHAPWAPTEITDFVHGQDVLDLRGMFAATGYSGSDPIADHYLSLVSDGGDGTKVLFDADGAAAGQLYPSYVIHLDHIAPGALTSADWIVR